jgi:hypothetical protein
MLEFKPTIISPASSEAGDHVEPRSSSFDNEQVHTSRFRRLCSFLRHFPLCGNNKPSPLSYIRRYNLLLHDASLVFAIPCLILVIVDLRTYMQNHEHARNKSNTNAIVVLDGLALTFFGLTIIYAIAYRLVAHLSGGLDHSSSTSTSFVYKTPLALFLIDVLIWAAVTAIANTILAMRTGSTTCRSWADVDSGNCEEWRKNIMRATGGLGEVLRQVQSFLFVAGYLRQ